MGGSGNHHWKALPEDDSFPRDAIEIQLVKMLQSPEFASAPRLKPFLEFIVKQHLQGNSDRLKEWGVAVDVFGKSPDFDPRLDSIVRAAAIRLRARLKAYYEGSGKTDEIIIEVPEGHYVPRFYLRAPEVISPRDEPEPQPEIPITTAALLLPAPESLVQVDPAEGKPFLGDPLNLAPSVKRILVVVLCLAAFAALALRFGAHPGILSSAATGGRSSHIKPIAKGRLNSRSAPVAAVFPYPWGRLLVKATSEGTSPQWITLRHEAEYLAATPDGLKVYVSTQWSRILSIVHPADGSVTTLTLPLDGGPLAMSPDGQRLYMGSMVDGVSVIDTRTDRIVATFLRTAGPVNDLAITPDGKKLFAATGPKGVWRARTDTGAMSQITDHVCPQYLVVDPQGGRLYVSYQCGGPTGRDGHDTMQSFDVETEKSLSIVSGPPAVGGPLSISPDARLMVWDGTDACEGPSYDHKDCPSVPSHVVHFLRPDEPQFFKALGLPDSMELGGFIGPRSLLLLGNSLVVMNASTYTWLENWRPGPRFRPMIVQRTQGRAYVGVTTQREMLVLQAESPECEPPAEGLVSFYSGDGVTSDVMGGYDLSWSNDAPFGPGRVGQAFLFDGRTNYLTTPSMGHFNFGYRDSSLALYVKFSSVKGEMVIMDRTSPRSAIHARLAKNEDDHLVFEYTTALGAQVRLVSKASVTENVWYHLCVTKDDHEVALYVNGMLEARHASSAQPAAKIGNESMPLFLGATKEQHGFLHGKLDEILFYNRALKPGEVRRLYEMRELGACRI